MKISDIENAINVLKICQYCWADQIVNDGDKIADYDAISQSIRCLNEYKKNNEEIH